MPVTITIQHDNADMALEELRVLARPLTRPYPPVVTTKPTPLSSEEDNIAQEVAKQNEAAAVGKQVDIEDAIKEKAPEPEPVKEKKTRATKPKVEKPVEPVKEETPETKAQDAADEKAESDAKATGALDHNSVRNALGNYVKKYGMVAVETDAPALFKLLYPDAKYTKISEIPTTQEDFKKVIAGIEEMTLKNPFKRELAK